MTNSMQQMIAQVADLDQQIYALEQTIAEDLMDLKAKREGAQSALNGIVTTEAMAQLRDKDYGCGTANIDAGTHKVKVTVSKKVKWDESQLRTIRQQIIDGGQDPAVYIKEKLSVSENAYKGFPDNIQQVFEPAREVTPSAPKIVITSK